MKKAVVREVIQTDTDSEGEASECSFTDSLTGSGFSSQVYNQRWKVTNYIYSRYCN